MFSSLSQSIGLNSSTMKKSIRMGTEQKNPTILLVKLSDNFVLLFPKKMPYFEVKLIVIAGVLENNEFHLLHSRSLSYIFSSLEAVLSRRARQNFNLSNWLDRVTWQVGCKQQVHFLPRSYTAH
ncbi:hypothetical protein RLOC_00012966 [Lonchura striata]|uniref:Uncharacterized protein n=1 Tax=Lonchura striata TaxID=40157 RepID=A0A218V323_9PASE|nr:hypothetical protein RLOC_00012966 [Lonchura striata domestica]